MQQNLRHEQQGRRDFIGDGFPRVIVTRIQRQQGVMRGRIAQIKLVRADGIAFHAEAE